MAEERKATLSEPSESSRSSGGTDAICRCPNPGRVNHATRMAHTAVRCHTFHWLSSALAIIPSIPSGASLSVFQLRIAHDSKPPWMMMMPITCKEARTRLVHIVLLCHRALISHCARTMASPTATTMTPTRRVAQMWRTCTTLQNVGMPIHCYGGVC